MIQRLPFIAKHAKPVTSIQLTMEEQQALLNIQHSILQMVVSNRPQQEILAELCLMAEDLVPKSIATVMMIKNQEYMDVISAPSVSQEDQALLNHVEPGPTAGSCGYAVYRNEATFVYNVHTDSRCLDIRNVFEHFELNACWSNPVRNVDGDSIGSFALSSSECREPSSFQKELLAISSYIIGIILERSKQQEQLEIMAYQDPLTGLANRSSLFIQLEQTIEQSNQQGNSFSLIFIDLDRFKTLNDTFGHSFGDQILKSVGKRLQVSILKANLLARVGGDQFVIIAKTIDDTAALAQNAIDALSMPIKHETYNILLDCSIGIAAYPADGESSETLLKNAETAMYRAKTHDMKICYFAPQFSSKAKEEFKIESDLRSAIENEEFELYFQAKVDAKTHIETGYEALIRWKNAENMFVSPMDFIPVAEKTGLIIPIGEWVVKTALAYAEELLSKSADSFNISINISGAQLENNHIEKLLNYVDKSSMPNNSIFFEITETVLVKEGSYSSDLLKQIRASGVQLSIDDFGMGHSSLSYLKRFKVSQLKMDKILINEIDINEESLAIAKAVIALGASLGLEVVAEGVETLAQASILGSLNCDTIQGFYFSKPAPFEQILRSKASC